MVFLDLPQAHRRVASLDQQLELDLDFNATVEFLPIVAQQLIEVFKTLWHGANALLLDEPAAVFASEEVTGLFNCARGLKFEGRSVILITHELCDVMEVADSITIMRDGKSVASMPKTDADLAQFYELLIGG